MAVLNYVLDAGRLAPFVPAGTVVFVREIAPRAAIAFTARVLYNASRARFVAYHWRFEGRAGSPVTVYRGRRFP